MAKRSVRVDSTSQREYVFLNDSTSTTGAGKTGIAFNASGLKAYYVRPGGSATAITLATQTVTGAYSSGGWVEVDSTNMPGVYRFDVPNAVFAAGVEKAIVMVFGATGMAPVVMEYELTAYDPYDTVRLGLTALPNVASGSAGAIITSGTGTAQLSVSSGNITVGGYASGQVPLQPTVAGRTLDVSTGGEAGIDWANVGSPTTTLNLSGTTISTSQAVASVSGAVGSVTGNVGGNVVGSVASVTGSVGSVTGSVGSVTGAVGSVTGNVGGNVVGSVASVTAAVTVGTNNDKTGYSLTTAPLTAVQTAAAVWNALTADYTTSGSYGERVLRSASSKADVKVTGTGAGHVGADVHELQPEVITSAAFAAGALDANALAADAATEIATAVYTGQLTESYRAAGVAPTLAQVAFELIAHMGDSAISGTTKTLRKLDGTTAKTFTLNSSTAPTAIEETT